MAREGLQGFRGVGLIRVHVQGGHGQALCAQDTLEPSLEVPKQALALGAQQEPGAARVAEAQHVAADAAHQALQKPLSRLAWGQGSAELRGCRARGQSRLRAWSPREGGQGERPDPLT